VNEKSPLRKQLGWFLFAGLLTAIALWIGFKLFARLGLVFALLFCLPVLAWAVARVAVEGTHESLKWMSDRSLEKWEGIYYAFNDVQIRVYEDDGQLLFAAADVLKSTGIPMIPDSLLATSGRQIPGTRLTGLSMPALEKLLLDRNEHEARRFLLWARREVVAPWKKKNGVRDDFPENRP
jgi:hypothetical protein